MPEGPEVRTVADKLRPYLVNRVITSSYTDDRVKTIGFFNLKCPATIVGVRSHGKKLLIDLNTSHMIIISLGMEGRVQYYSGNHSHVRFDISNCEINGPFNVMKFSFSIYFDDPRCMGGVDIIPNEGIPLYFKDIGPDLLQLALDEKTWIPLETWISIFAQKKLKNRMICDILLDQSLVAGLGNYLRSEILYYAMIHPLRKVSSVNIDEWDSIRISAHKVILLAYSRRGFTIKSFISPDGDMGTYPAVVYGKSFDPYGNPVITTDVKDRKIHWVPNVQV